MPTSKTTKTEPTTPDKKEPKGLTLTKIVFKDGDRRLTTIDLDALEAHCPVQRLGHGKVALSGEGTVATIDMGNLTLFNDSLFEFDPPFADRPLAIALSEEE